MKCETVNLQRKKDWEKGRRGRLSEGKKEGVRDYKTREQDTRWGRGGT